jgi:LysM repeat protein
MSCDWTKIKTEYITDSKSSYRKIAEKYGVPFTTLKDRAKKEGWADLKIQTQHDIVTKTIDKDINKKVDRATRLLDVTDNVLSMIEATVAKYHAEGNVLDKSALKQITGALKDIKDIQGVKSDMDIREQEARIRNLERQAEAENKDNEIVIRVAGSNATDYCE